MESEPEKLRRELQRYRFLLAYIADQRAAAALRELVAETEARLGAFEPRVVWRGPALRRLN